MIPEDQRKIILDVLAQSKKPVSIRDLVAALKAATKR
jgi:Fe2+ or Zn2+ uptake regulation protein